MKKIYFTLGLGVLFLGTNAQQTMKIKNPIKTNHSKSVVARGNGHNSVAQLTGGIICNNNYVAGTTMNLNLTVNFTNTDQEYCDSLAITFPAGFTINSTNATPLFPTNDNGTGVVRDSLNPIVGQTISWGKNDNGQYGGISAGGAINFAINVTITATVTGTQYAPFFASGDTYGSTPGDLAPGAQIVLNPAVPNDLASLAAATQTGCMAMAMPSGVGFQFWNKGTAAQSNFPVKYIANGGTPVVETYTGTVNPGDTVIYVFTTPLTMSVNTVYAVQALTALSTDVDMTNDTTSTIGYNSFSPTYSTSFETNAQVAGWSAQHVTGSGNSWNLDATLPHSGSNDALAFAGVTGASDDWFFSPCLNLTAGHTYQVKYYAMQYTGSTYAGQLGVSLGDSASAAKMTTSLIAAHSLTTGTVATAYKADSISFPVTTTGSYVIGFEAINTNNSKQVAILVDDINITDLGPTGIKTLTNSNDLAIYPNPTSGLLNITTTASTATVEIFNLMGQNVLSKTVTNGTSTIDISNLSSGVYSVQIMQNNTLTVGKVIKTN